jgi:8-oxo-dGTP pyrophosphatase MutT (NUDIX family)
VAAPFEEKNKIETITQAQIAARLQRSYRKNDLPATDGYIGRPAEGEKKSPKCAAVLIPATFFQGEWHLLYTRRTDTLNDHSGQVSFPGGQCDPEDETPEKTALREAEEEIGLKPQDVEVLGRVNEVVTVTHYEITPIVGTFPFPYSFLVSTVEVGRVFTMPLNWLANPRNYWQFQHPKAHHPTIAYHPYDGELLWGATARITLNFLKAIKLI